MTQFRIGRIILATLSFTAHIGLSQGATPEVAPSPRPVQRKLDCRIDTDRFIFTEVHDDDRIRTQDANPIEFEAYNEVLLQARRFSNDELMKEASADITFADLVKPIRREYQFKLLKLEGRLSRLRRVDPTNRLAEAKVTDLYEAWVFPNFDRDPICLLVTELPEGIKPSLEYLPTKRIKFAAYSFKLMRYDAPNPENPGKTIVRRAPLLMGRTFTVLENPPEETKNWVGDFVPMMLGALGLIGVSGFGLAMWFHKGDAAVLRKLQTQRVNPFNDPPPTAEETPNASPTPTESA